MVLDTRDAVTVIDDMLRSQDYGPYAFRSYKSSGPGRCAYLDVSVKADIVNLAASYNEGPRPGFGFNYFYMYLRRRAADEEGQDDAQ
jgi:hypothetical protein